MLCVPRGPLRAQGEERQRERLASNPELHLAMKQTLEAPQLRMASDWCAPRPAKCSATYHNSNESADWQRAQPAICIVSPLNPACVSCVRPANARGPRRAALWASLHHTTQAALTEIFQL